MVTGQPQGVRTPAPIKCVVWDLDNTLWDGVLLEGDRVSLRPEVVDVVRALDGRGILHSISSKNDHAAAMEVLSQSGIAEYFLYPHINWNSKVASLKGIARALNIGIETLAFVDDQAFEREEVAFSLPEVLCIDAGDIGRMPDMPRMQPRVLSQDGKSRRLMYLTQQERDRAEQAFSGSSEQFLATLRMVFTIARAREEDLLRAEELTMRTHQLNTTGYTYSYAELDALRQSEHHTLLIAGLSDVYGPYGTIGLALLERGEETWTIKLLLMSCRVMSRGVGTIMLNCLMQRAKEAGVRLRAEFVPNDRNRMMLITLRFAGFREVERAGDLIVFESDLSTIQPFPEYAQVQSD
jgi:FkbH-like protein